jgi:hypothetical protein
LKRKTTIKTCLKKRRFEHVRIDTFMISFCFKTSLGWLYKPVRVDCVTCPNLKISKPFYQNCWKNYNYTCIFILNASHLDQLHISCCLFFCYDFTCRKQFVFCLPGLTLVIVCWFLHYCYCLLCRYTMFYKDILNILKKLYNICIDI